MKLDDGGNQLFAAIDGYGVYSTLAPHRFTDPRVVSAADFVARAAAPGSLVSVAGARVTSGQAQGQEGNVPVKVLASTDTETQIQIPFEARGTTLSLAVSAGGSQYHSAVGAARSGCAGDFRLARRHADAVRCRHGSDAGCDDAGAVARAYPDPRHRPGSRDSRLADRTGPLRSIIPRKSPPR